MSGPGPDARLKNAPALQARFFVYGHCCRRAVRPGYVSYHTMGSLPTERR